jgi:hypothetical protein
MFARLHQGDLDELDLQILRILSKGTSTDLNLPMRTRQRRIATIKTRLGAPSTIAAVVTAIRRGLI